MSTELALFSLPVGVLGPIRAVAKETGCPRTRAPWSGYLKGLTRRARAGSGRGGRSVILRGRADDNAQLTGIELVMRETTHLSGHV